MPTDPWQISKQHCSEVLTIFSHKEVLLAQAFGKKSCSSTDVDEGYLTTLGKKLEDIHIGLRKGYLMATGEYSSSPEVAP